MPVVWPRNAGTSYTGSQSATPCQCLAISVPRSPNQSNCLWLAQCCPTAGERVDLTGRQFPQQGEQINEMANTALYTNGQFVTCSGFDLGALSRTVTGATAWFQPTTIYAPVVLDCNGGTGQNLANQPTNTSPVLVQQVNACTWTASPVLDSTGSFYRVGVAETVKITGTTTWVVQLRNPKAQLHAVGRAAGGKPKKEDVMKWVTSLLGSCFLLAVLDSRGELSSARPSTCV